MYYVVPDMVGPPPRGARGGAEATAGGGVPTRLSHVLREVWGEALTGCPSALALHVPWSLAVGGRAESAGDMTVLATPGTSWALPWACLPGRAALERIQRGCRTSGQQTPPLLHRGESGHHGRVRPRRETCPRWPMTQMDSSWSLVQFSPQETKPLQ